MERNRRNLQELSPPLERLLAWRSVVKQLESQLAQDVRLFSRRFPSAWAHLTEQLESHLNHRSDDAALKVCHEQCESHVTSRSAERFSRSAWTD
jgi:hypothetical protein